MASCDRCSAKSKSRRRRDRLRRTAILQSEVKSDNLKQMLFTPQEYGLLQCSILGWDPSAFMFQPCQWERGSLNPEVLLGALSEIQVDLDVTLPVPHRRELRDTCSHTESLRTPATPLGRTAALAKPLCDYCGEILPECFCGKARTCSHCVDEVADLRNRVGYAMGMLPQGTACLEFYSRCQTLVAYGASQSQIPLTVIQLKQTDLPRLLRNVKEK